ncbi:hypothetical protein AL542_18320 [Grimontia hollisae]|uniref:Uncharacterized protein n=1 Tax=Grimontia hollisae TaxID=673 RepID=A0A377J886_GRIHO|nr:hypothetical protein [Grimontia hollisae]AUW37782.1 hypothetical protein AL542_18320 [Grimontia hollisae]MDF2185126.1 hypothetical protein [Grimontia hollisae]STO76615.1 Uncharacterised protein [Grimontia hollisae]STO98721.1 Uncharacterised protein [Grimontia hollisae]STQ76148.1 Uncharacterised protein [Grimontia hollisae]
MPLVSCPVCEKQVSKHALSCPGCGEPDPAGYHTRNAWLSRLFWLLVWIGIGAAVWYKVVPLVMEMFKR